ncbi:MAG TPA: type II secretion system protein [Bacillota bacterium]|jgi:prepilin-type N-terminal cleavage/methylation domain-containing protein|nr:type II secretion system protein [Bacillota bacterium]
MLNKRSKKGFTLVEVLAATIILALIATGVLGGLGFSQRMVRANSSKDAYAARVQEAADVIIACINDQRSIPDIAAEMDYVRVNAGSPFSSAENRIQFIAENSFNGSGLYRITAALYFDTANGRDSVSLICFAFPGSV